MAGSTPLQLYQYPTTTDQASPAAIQTLAQAMERQVVAVFADPATRDSRWTAATGLANGAMCFVVSTGELQLRSAGSWIVIGGRPGPFAVATGTVSFTTAASGTVAYGSAVATFPTGRFNLGPNVLACVSSGSSPGVSNGYLSFQCYGISTTSCTINGSWQANANTASVSVAWIATQMTAISTTG